MEWKWDVTVDAMEASTLDEKLWARKKTNKKTTVNARINPPIGLHNYTVGPTTSSSHRDQGSLPAARN